MLFLWMSASALDPQTALWGHDRMHELPTRGQEIWSNGAGLSMRSFQGPEAEYYREQIADLRLSVFKEFPYLYEGIRHFEDGYLNIYFRSPNSRIILVFDQEGVVGFGSAIPLSDEREDIQRPFVDASKNLSDYLYIGELILYPEYRSKGLVKHLPSAEEYAKEKGCKHIAFLTVVRPDDHPSRPKDYRSLEPLWQKLGYQKFPDMQVRVPWILSDTQELEENILEVWSKTLES